MLTLQAKTELEKQQYRVVGNHSAVKICGWTKTMIRGEGGCYKLKFYGIMSNQCLQMTTSISCANRCVFCWRGYKAPVSKEWKWSIDDPELIYKGSLEAQQKLLIGFRGSEKVNKTVLEASKTVKHVALSLTGEPIIYPKINESIELFNKDGISTFLVTNGQYPEQIKDLKPITQLYLSLDAPTKESLKKIDVPLFDDYWERLHQSLKYLAKKKQKTCIRLTLIKNVNDIDFDKYAELINIGDPDFIEVKAYMFVGQSRERLKKENMPLHEEVVKFSKELIKYLPEYSIVSEHIPSRVVMFAKNEHQKNGVWYTWIDFEKWNQLVNSSHEFTAFDYSKKTPEVGISGKGTLDAMSEEVRKRYLQENKIFVNEEIKELEFYDN